MKFQIFAYLFLFFIASAQTKVKAQKTSGTIAIDTITNRVKTMSDYSPTFDKAHSNAKRLMAEDFYFSTTDETAPFGNDDGADTYAGFADWRLSHKQGNPKVFLQGQLDRWGYPKFDIYETDIKKLKPYLAADKLHARYMTGIDQAIVAIAFGQLYLEGTIDKDFRELARATIERELLPGVLGLWDRAYQPERKAKLKKMLAILNS